MVLRIKRPDVPRPFRVAGGPVIPVLGVLSCVYLMVSLSVMTWVRFLLWLDLGMLIYWFYGRTHSPLADPLEAANRSGRESLANFLKISGYLLLFNGVAVLGLALLTQFNVTNEGLAKWHEVDEVITHVGLHINPEIADQFGITILIIGAVVAGAGWLLGPRPSRPQASVR
jgi:amino acid transporter